MPLLRSGPPTEGSLTCQLRRPKYSNVHAGGGRRQRNGDARSAKHPVVVRVRRHPRGWCLDGHPEHAAFGHRPHHHRRLDIHSDPESSAEPASEDCVRWQRSSRAYRHLAGGRGMHRLHLLTPNAALRTSVKRAFSRRVPGATAVSSTNGTDSKTSRGAVSFLIQSLVAVLERSGRGNQTFPMEPEVGVTMDTSVVVACEVGADRDICARRAPYRLVEIPPTDPILPQRVDRHCARDDAGTRHSRRSWPRVIEDRGFPFVLILLGAGLITLDRELSQGNGATTHLQMSARDQP